MKILSPVVRIACGTVIALSAVSGLTAEVAKPETIRCRGASNIGCGENGICIADRFNDRNPITFKLKANRYSSPRGSGSITEQHDLPDGRHSISVSSPPASGEFIFSEDWLSGSAGGSIGYDCEMLDD